jgi:hypothetical protein
VDFASGNDDPARHRAVLFQKDDVVPRWHVERYEEGEWIPKSGVDAGDYEEALAKAVTALQAAMVEVRVRRVSPGPVDCAGR